MELVTHLMTPSAFALALSVAFIAGVVKGMVGFAMPMILISGLSSVISPELALAGLILPTLITNGMQALRQGPRAAWESLLKFRGYLGTLLIVLILSAQLIRVIPVEVMLLIIGVPIVIFAATQLAGIPLRIASPPTRATEIGIGAFAGFIGGLSGVWGPPTVAYLTALDTPKPGPHPRSRCHLRPWCRCPLVRSYWLRRRPRRNPAVLHRHCPARHSRHVAGAQGQRPDRPRGLPQSHAVRPDDRRPQSDPPRPDGLNENRRPKTGPAALIHFGKIPRG